MGGGGGGGGGGGLGVGRGWRRGGGGCQGAGVRIERGYEAALLALECAVPLMAICHMEAGVEPPVCGGRRRR